MIQFPLKHLLYQLMEMKNNYSNKHHLFKMVFLIFIYEFIYQQNKMNELYKNIFNSNLIFYLNKYKDKDINSIIRIFLLYIIILTFVMYLLNQLYLIKFHIIHILINHQIILKFILFNYKFRCHLN